mgnify:CR=1 FL=1
MKDNLKSVGMWGQLHYQYLQKTRPSLIGVMRMNGELIPYLQDINQQADEMLSLLIKQLAKQEGVTEELKAKDQMAWIGAMGNIQHRAREVVLNEIVYQ